MKKSNIICYCIIFSLSILIISCSEKENPDIQIKKFNNYPSASSIEYFDGKLYVVGDDATDLLVLDTNLNVIDSIPIISYPGNRIPKETKPDLEASALYTHGSNNFLLLFGSMFILPYRDWCWLYDLKTKTIDSISLQPLHTKIKNSGIEQVNIEGACIAYDYLIMANRGNKSYPKNYLIIGPKDLWKRDSNYQIAIMPVTTKSDTTNFSGISGLFYSEKSNLLIMSVSSEDTRSTYEDGTIGKSYLWIVDNFSIKRSDKTISPNRIIDLEEIDKRFKGYKIESATVISETNELFHLALAADNDDGTSTIFKMTLKKG